MDIKIKARDGPSRICELQLKKNTLITPNILFLSTSRFKRPEKSDIFLKISNKKKTRKLKNIYLKNVKDIINIMISNKNYFNNSHKIIYNTEDIDNINIKYKKNILFIVGNTIDISKKQKDVLNLIIKLREKIGYNNLIYLPTISNLSNLSLFSYVGIDIFDCISAIISARNNDLFFLYGNQNINKLKQIPCSCKYCKKYVDEPVSMPFENILKHNYEALINEIICIKNQIFNGTLRELVELRVKTNINSTAILRLLDDQYYSYIEEKTPIFRRTKLIATTKEVMNRVEIRRFQERVIERYKKPDSLKILLILPCSAKKPYSFSKSHKKFREKLFHLKNPNIIHEIIITSPIGIVPRELELIYPASNYDIPVIGFWDEEEKKIIKILLKKYLIKNKYDKIILHLPKNIKDFLSDIIINPITTEIVGNPASKESLNSLVNVLKEESKIYSKINSEQRKVENIKSILSYQFNENIAKILVKDCIIKGRYPYQKIFYQNIQLGMLTKERGFISLTMAGANKIFKSHKYCIEIFDDFLLKGSLFAPGIKKADKEIRIGDEVFILKSKKLCGVGVAQMNGIEMMELNYGEAVKVRHKV